MRSKYKRGERHPVEFVAREFGVDRKALERRLDAKNVDCGAGVTLREAFAAWISKDDRDAARTRQQIADAESAEIDAAEKRGTLMLTENHVRWAKDYGTQVRAKVMEADIPVAEKKKLCAAITEIEVE